MHYTWESGTPRIEGLTRLAVNGHNGSNGARLAFFSGILIPCNRHLHLLHVTCIHLDAPLLLSSQDMLSSQDILTSLVNAL
jgi:hypothetical protein